MKEKTMKHHNHLIYHTYRGDATAADLTTYQIFYNTNYGYDAGGYANNTSSLVSDKLIAKLDWNINDNNTLSLKA